MLTILDELNLKYGIYKESQYQTWIDRLRIRNVGGANWLVRFDVWKRTSEFRILSAICKENNCYFGCCMFIA